MALITLAQARTALWQYGKIGVPLVVATIAQKEAFRDKLNRVSERLLIECKAKYTMRRVNVPVLDGHVTLPRELASASQMTPGCGCSNPWMIYTKFHEMAMAGWQCDEVIPATETAQTVRTPTPPFTLRIKSTAAGGAISFIKGRDENWDEYFNTVTVTPINGTVNHVRIYSAMPRIVKPVTSAEIELYSVNAGTETLLAIYSPGETSPSYMRYLTPFGCDGDLVMVLGKLAHIDAIDETDIVFPSLYSALEKGLDALDRDSKADYARADALYAKAAELLDKDRREFDGDAQPVINMLGGVGAADIYAVR